jgi:signal recognition particle GTPase
MTAMMRSMTVEVRCPELVAASGRTRFARGAGVGTEHVAGRVEPFLSTREMVTRMKVRPDDPDES